MTSLRVLGSGQWSRLTLSTYTEFFRISFERVRVTTSAPYFFIDIDNNVLAEAKPKSIAKEANKRGKLVFGASKSMINQ